MRSPSGATPLSRVLGGVLLGGVLLGGCTAGGAESVSEAGAGSSAAALDDVISREATFTQGLELLDDGTILHSRGLYGESGIDILSATGEVLRSAELPDDKFGEGVTVVPRGFDDANTGPFAYQLTWKSGVVHTWSVPDLQEGPALEIDGEGWGLCFDATRDVLWLSDGTATLRSLAIKDLSPLGEVTVREAGVDGETTPVAMLNELECVDGAVWANVWKQDDVVQISPETGMVEQRVDLTATVARETAKYPEDVRDEPANVLNGIAYDDRDGSFLITGKNWSQMFRVDLLSN